MTELEKRIKASETRICKMVFPPDSNHYHTLFGGLALQLMDEAAYISATRFARKTVVTVSAKKVDFLEPVPMGSIAEVIAKVDKVGRTSINVTVEIFFESLHSDKRSKALQAEVSFVAVGEDRKPVAVMD